MDSAQINKIKYHANNEVIKRLLIKYFIEKGFTESFDLQLNPIILQDLVQQIPVLASKIEIIPFMEELDNIQSKATLGWNLFVLGTQRMYLGETYHTDLKDLARQINEGQLLIPENNSKANRLSTPKRVIHFITRSLSNKKGGYVDLAIPPTNSLAGLSNMSKTSQSDFYKRSGYGV